MDKNLVKEIDDLKLKLSNKVLEYKKLVENQFKEKYLNHYVKWDDKYDTVNIYYILIEEIKSVEFDSNNEINCFYIKGKSISVEHENKRLLFYNYEDYTQIDNIIIVSKEEVNKDVNSFLDKELEFLK